MRYDRSSEHNAAAGGESAATMTQSMDPSSQAYIYSDTNIQNTIAGLGNAMDSLQAHQVYMHSKQETMSSALQQVMTMLQLLTQDEHKDLRKVMTTVATCKTKVGLVPHMAMYRK